MLIPDGLIKRICLHLEKNGRFGLACSVAVALMFWEGLRIGDVCRIKKRGIYIDGAYPRIKFTGKGGRKQTIAIGVDTLPILKKYMDSGLYLLSTDSFLVVGSSGCPLYRRHIARGLQWATNGNLSPHQLRHANVSRKREKGVPDPVISKSIGHMMMGTTMKYGRPTKVQIDRDFYQPNPQNLVNFPVPARVHAGDYIASEQLDGIFMAIPKQREKLIFCLIAFCGLKSTELEKLTRSNWKGKESHFFYDERYFPVNYRIARFLNSALKYMNPSDPIFTISHEGIKRSLQNLSSDFDEHINGKILRNSYIVRQLDRGVKPTTLAEILGCSYDNVARFIPHAARAKKLAERNYM